MQAHLGTLDLDVHEGTALFHLLDAWQQQVGVVKVSCLCVLVVLRVYEERARRAQVTASGLHAVYEVHEAEPG